MEQGSHSSLNAQEAERILEGALALAEKWQNRATAMLTQEEKVIQQRLMRLLDHPTDKAVLTRLIDQSFRSSNNRRVADQVCWLLKKYGPPANFAFSERLLSHLFKVIGKVVPNYAVPKMIEKMREDSGRAIIHGEADELHAHLAKRKAEGVRMNVNHLGEAVLGEKEAMHRLEKYIETLSHPDFEYISVKISTIYSQITSIGIDHSVAILKERLSRLYRTAQNHFFTFPDGRRVPKFVNLDMEEYRDLDITTAAFMQTLDQEEFKNHAAGIVLQAYLPDSHEIQKQLIAWAQARVAAGGSPVKLRIVKGANMEMEQVESSLHNWPLAPYDNKRDVDANYKRMVQYGMRPENIRAVNLGIASHNLFDIAHAYLLAKHYGVTDHFVFEMLEGMADHVRRAVQETTGTVLFYAPVAAREQFINAIGYLVRRLDENTSPENFLRYAPNLKTGTREWNFLREQFIEAFKYRERPRTTPHRTQNRLTETPQEGVGSYYKGEFLNESDTDWALAVNREWAKTIRARWKKNPGDAPLEIPIVVAGEEAFEGREIHECFDPSQYADKVMIARHALANDEDAERAAKTANDDPDGWSKTTLRERHALLSKVAVELRKARGDLIGASMADTGKVITEADVEVSEAIDFAEFYPYSVKTFTELGGIRAGGKGVVLVISPWNFPIAIPCGGIVASLSAGNRVIFKPSSDAVVTAWELCKCFYRAGVSKNVLQFVPCSGSGTGAKLTANPVVDAVILTGGTDTGLKVLKQRPDVLLNAETGGKNATIVTAMSDRDQAMKNVVYSAFGNCGQKCSATSLLILEKEVYEDQAFREQLVDAAASLAVGSAWDFENRMGPMIKPPAGDLLNALTKLEPGESWALEPKNVDGNPYIWSPGIKWGVKPGSYTHNTEFFGPVLAVMCAKDLDEAIAFANMTGYGLTSGVESLDPREQEQWKSKIRAGNLYVNRGTTGAITLRQPFGGMGKSVLGSGMKAGGPDYVSQFMNFEETDLPAVGPIGEDHALHRLALEWYQKVKWGQMPEIKEDIEKTVRAVKSYLYRFDRDFSGCKDYFHLRGQDNLLRYLPVGAVVVRLHEKDCLFETLARIAAAKIVGCPVKVSIPTGFSSPVLEFLRSKEGEKFMCDVPIVVQSDAQLIGTIPKLARIRYAAPDRVPAEVFQAAAATGFFVSRQPVVMEGRIELLQYLMQQSICDAYHRYGNLGERTII